MREAVLGRIDVAVAVVVAAVGQQEAWAPLQPGFSHRVGPAPALAAAFLLSAAALLWRRRAPLLVVAAVNGVLSLEFLVFGAPDGLANFLPPVIAFYSAGRHGDTGRFVPALAITAAGMVVHELRDPMFAFTGPTVVFWVILLGSGLLGRVFNSRARDLQTVSRHAEQLEQEREERERAATAAERARIARELHDLVGHGLSLIVLQTVAAQGSLEQGALAATGERLEQLETTARTTLAEMRRLVSVSGDDDAALSPQPGIGDIGALVAQVRGSGVVVDLSVAGEPIEVPGGLGLAVYRLVQEALTNVVKHAQPVSGTRVVLERHGDALCVEVLDSGRGPVGDLHGGRGLAGMRERVALYGGTLRVGPRPEGGFAVRASFPLGAEPA